MWSVWYPNKEKKEKKYIHKETGLRWELVSTERHNLEDSDLFTFISVARLPAPGGWLYRHKEISSSPTKSITNTVMCFVPKPPTQEGVHDG